MSVQPKFNSSQARGLSLLTVDKGPRVETSLYSLYKVAELLVIVLFESHCSYEAISSLYVTLEVLHLYALMY